MKSTTLRALNTKLKAPISKFQYSRNRLSMYMLPVLFWALASIFLPDAIMHVDAEAAYGIESDTRENMPTTLADLSLSPAVPSLVYVDLNAVGTGDGTSWANAFTDIQSAIDAISTLDNDTIEVASGTYLPAAIPVSITMSKELYIRGTTGSTVVIDCDASTSYGILLQKSNSGLENLRITLAGTFGIHSSCGADNLMFIDVDVDNSGGTGITINGCNVALLKDMSSTDNGGNGMSLTDCSNITIDGYTSSGNEFSPGGFGAGIGIFSANLCPSGFSENIVIQGTVTTAEVPAVYVEDNNGMVTGALTLPASVTHVVHTYNPTPAVMSDLYYYFSNLVSSYAAAEAVIAAGLPADSTYAQELATSDYYVNAYMSSGTDQMLIQGAVNFAPAGSTIHLEKGYLDGNVVIDQNDLTIMGSGHNFTQSDLPLFTSILRPAATGDNTKAGVFVNTGVTGTHLTLFRIRDYKTGVEANGQNHNSTFDELDVVDNVIAGSQGGGIYMNGSVENVTIDNCYAYGNQNRGIVIWNGHKTNITITNNSVINGTGCCGIELQDGTASGVTMSNNDVVGNGDSGMSAVGLTSGAGPNIIANNTIEDNGRFGIEIKLPDGTGLTSGDGSIVVEGNVVEINAAPSDARDIAGIAVFRRGIVGAGNTNNNVDMPNGVVVRNNTVSGYSQPSTSEGFGIVVEGIDHTVSGNTLLSNNIGIQLQSGHDPSSYMVLAAGDGDQSNLADNYFGRGNAPFSCGIEVLANIFGMGGASNTTADFRQVGALTASGGAIVTNDDTGEEFCLIQAAIDNPNTLDGHTLSLAEGTYKEDVVVNKELTISGPNAGISPNTGSRVAEAILMPVTKGIDFHEMLKVQASNVTIDGLTFDGDNPDSTSGFTSTNGADIDAAEAITIYVDNVDSLQVLNNIMQNLSYFGVTIYGSSFSAPSTSGHRVHDNLIRDMGTYDNASGIALWGGGVLIYNDQYTRITDNVMNNVRIGVQTGNFHDPNPGPAIYQVMDNNTILARRRGIFYNLHTGNPAPLTLSNNAITGLFHASETRWDGMLLASLSDAAGIVSDNTINGGTVTISSSGIVVWNVNVNAPVDISGGSIANVDIGLDLNNYEGYFNSDAGNGAHAVISNINIMPPTGKIGIRLHDNPASTNNNVQLTINPGVQVNGGLNGLVVEGGSCTILNASDLVLNTQAGNYIELISNAMDIDATGASFDGQLITAATRSAIELKVHHQADDAALGLVIPLIPCTGPELVKNTTTGEFFCTIQKAIDDADTENGHTLEVEPGTYDEQVLVNKRVKILGIGLSKPIVTFTGTVTGKPTLFDISIDSVTVEGLQFEVDLTKLASAIIASGSDIDTLSFVKSLWLNWRSFLLTLRRPQCSKY
jgi:hypothetical protein